MRLYYWIEQHFSNDPLFAREACAAYLTEAQKFQTNEDYYNKTLDPATFIGVIYYHNPQVTLNALYKVVKQLRMPNILDDIKTCILAATDPSIGTQTLIEQKAKAELCRQTTTGKNNLLARIASSLFILRTQKPKGPRVAWSIVKLMISYMKTDDASSKLMTLLRKEISLDALEQCLAE